MGFYGPSKALKIANTIQYDAEALHLIPSNRTESEFSSIHTTGMDSQRPSSPDVNIDAEPTPTPYIIDNVTLFDTLITETMLRETTRNLFVNGHSALAIGGFQMPQQCGKGSLWSQC